MAIIYRDIKIVGDIEQDSNYQVKSPIDIGNTTQQKAIRITHDKITTHDYTKTNNKWTVNPTAIDEVVFKSDLKEHTFNDLATEQGAQTNVAPSNNLLKESSFARVYREADEIPGITYPVAIGVVLKAMKDQNLLNTILTVGCSNANENKITGLPVIGSEIQTYGMLVVQVPGTDALRMRVEYSREIGNGNVIKWIGGINRSDPNNWTVNWRMLIDDSSAQTITGIKTFATGATPLITDAPTTDLMAVNKAYADLKVALAGAQTITGIKTFATGATPLITDAPTNNLHAVNKSYVDGAIPAVINALDNSSTTNALSANMGKTINDKLIASRLQLGNNATASGAFSTALGSWTQAKGSSSTALGETAAASGAFSTALGYYAVTSESESETMRLGDNNNLSALKCRVALTTTSDERDKADITAIPNSLDFIDRLTPITYKSNQRTAYLSDEQKESENYKKYGLADYDKIAHASGTKKGSRQRVGLKAQEIQQALAEVYGTADYANLVDDNFHDLENKPQDVENQLTVAYSNIIPFLVGAIKELKAEIDLLKGE